MSQSFNMGNNAKTEQSIFNFYPTEDVYENVPLVDLSYDLTDKEFRFQTCRKRQFSRKIARQKQFRGKRTLKWCRKALHAGYESQSKFQDVTDGISRRFANMWRDLCLKVENPGMEKIMHYGENVLLLLTTLKGCNSWTSALAAIAMYIKTHCKDQILAASIIELVKVELSCSDLEKFFDKCISEEEEKDFDSQSSSMITPFDNVFGIWDTVKKSPLKTKLSSLISTALAVGLLSESKTLAPSVQGLTLFRIAAAKKNATVTDLLGTIISTMKFFVERGYKCFDEQSLEPLLFDDDAALDFQKDYVNITSNFDFVKVGVWRSDKEACPWSDEKDFELCLENTIDKCKTLLKSASVHDRILLGRSLENLIKIRTAFQLLRTSGGLREAPFAFNIYGESGIGKSTIVNNLINFSLQRLAYTRGEKDFKVDPNSICTINEMDKYHSDYKAHIRAVLLDDFANGRAEITGINPAVNVINFINNVQRTAIMAEAELKGKIPLNPDVVASTTNVEDMAAREYSNEPVSVLRRFQIHVKAVVKPEWLKDQDMKFIDSAKLAAAAKEGNLCPDAWDFHVYEWYSGQNVKCAKKTLTYIDEDGVKRSAECVDMKTLLLIFKQYTAHHVEIQKSVVTSSKQIYENTLCEHGDMPYYCDHCRCNVIKKTEEEEDCDDVPELISRTEQEQDEAEDEEDEDDDIPEIPNLPMDDDEVYCLPCDEDKEQPSIFQSQSYVVESGCDNAPEDRFYWWEHLVADFSLILYPLLWYLIAFKNYTVKWNKILPDHGWIYALLLLTGGFPSKAVPALLYIYFGHYLTVMGPPAFFKFYKNLFEMILRPQHQQMYYSPRTFTSQSEPVVPEEAIEHTSKVHIEPTVPSEAIEHTSRIYVEPTLPDDAREVPSLSRTQFNAYYTELKKLGDGLTQPTNWIPASMWNKFSTQWLVTVMNSKDFIKHSLSYWLLAAATSAGLNPLNILSAIGACFVGFSATLLARKHFLISKLTQARDYMPTVFKNIRDADISRGKLLFVFFAAIVALYMVYMAMKYLTSEPKYSVKKAESQGNEFSVHMEKQNPWLEVAPVPLPEPATKDCSPEQLQNVLDHNQVLVTYGRESCQGLILGSALLAVPNHVVADEYTQVTIRRTEKGKLDSANFSCKIHPKDVYRMPELDMAVVYVPRLGDRKNILDLFPEKRVNSTLLTHSIRREDDGTLYQEKHRLDSFKAINTGKAKFLGGLVNYSVPTFHGQCFTTHISIKKSAMIIGFHAAGIPNTSRGAITCVSRGDLLTAINELKSRDHVVIPKSMGLMETQSYGIDYTPNDFISGRSPTKYQTNAQLQHFGTMEMGKVRPKTAVMKSPASDAVTEVTGVANEYGPPANCRIVGERCPDWQPYQKYLEGAGNAYQEFPADVLEWALKDYVSGIDRLCASDYGKKLLQDVKVLDDVETVSGLDGMNFCGGMKPGTSMGWPINKSKEEFMIELEEPHENVTVPRILDDDTMRIAAEARKTWLEGQRTYSVFKTCTKDEPTKLSKDKVRCFQAAPAALQVNIRKYYLTMCQFLSMSSKTSECAVGINAQGRGWHELNEYMIRFGEDRIVAGDFKAYDQHMSARMILLSNKVFEHIGRKAGYTDEDLSIMNGCVTEIAYPVMSLNGELIQLYGSNPSGQNLTVYTNSIVNSLYHRCVFRELYPTYKGKFSDAVALMSYGDDVKFSVHPDFNLFNHTEIQRVFAKYGIDYTMAEKDAESVPFINHMDADFLKRKSRWEPDYCYKNESGEICKGMWLAMLDESSIFKSLHCNLKSSVQTQEEVAIACIEGALREWWFYGKDHFNMRHAQMKQVVDNLGWTNFMSGQFADTFEVREANWKLNNEVFAEGDDLWDSQSRKLTAAFTTTLIPYPTVTHWKMPILIHDTQISVADPFEEELFLAKPQGCRILCQEYMLNRYVGDLLVVIGDDAARPVFVCLELKSSKVARGYAQAERMSAYLQHYVNAFDARTGKHDYEPIIIAAAMTPQSFLHNATIDEHREILELWFTNFKQLTRASGRKKKLLEDVLACEPRPPMSQN